MSERRALETKLVERARTDPAFRKALLANPRAVLENELGGKLPEGISIEVHEETVNTLHLVLPLDPAAVPEPLLRAIGGAWGAAASAWGRKVE